MRAPPPPQRTDLPLLRYDRRPGRLHDGEGADGRGPGGPPTHRRLGAGDRGTPDASRGRRHLGVPAKKKAHILESRNVPWNWSIGVINGYQANFTGHFLWGKTRYFY